MTAALLLLAVGLIAANGFFVGAEFAVLASRRATLEPLLRSSRRARTALGAIEQLPLMISACQFGITLASLGLGALAEPVVASRLTGPLAALHVPHELVHPLALGIALTLVSCLHMLLGEMVPKNLALTGPERAAMMLAPPLLLLFVQIFRPIIIGLTAVATGVLKLLRIQPASEIGEVTDRDSVAALIGESSEEGLLKTNQQELLTGALAFEETMAHVVKLPLADLVPASLLHLITCPLDCLLCLGAAFLASSLARFTCSATSASTAATWLAAISSARGALRGYVLVSLPLSLSHHVGDFAFAFIPRCVDLLVTVGFDLRGGLRSLLRVLGFLPSMRLELVGALQRRVGVSPSSRAPRSCS